MSQSPSERPLPAYVYRRRRLAVFGGLGGVILLIWLVVAHPWSTGPAQPPATSGQILPGASNPASIGNAGTAAACDPTRVDVTAYTDADTYAAGQFPQLTVGVTNTGAEPCSLNVGTSQQIFTITGGGEVFWVSTDCQQESSNYDLVLKPGVLVRSEPIQWDRTRSNPGTCALVQREPVPAAGSPYRLTATVDGITSPAAEFQLN